MRARVKNIRLIFQPTLSCTTSFKRSGDIGRVDRCGGEIVPFSPTDNFTLHAGHNDGGQMNGYDLFIYMKLLSRYPSLTMAIKHAASEQIHSTDTRLVLFKGKLE